MSPYTPQVEDTHSVAVLLQISRKLDVVIDFLKLAFDLLPSAAGPPDRLTIHQEGPVRIQGKVTTMQIHDNEEFDIVVNAQDSKGQDVSDSFTATSSDETIVTVTTGADGKTFTIIAGVPGSAVVTITDGTLSATEAVDVVAGAAATISLVAGAATPQP